ncbi:MAG: hypothetical protein EBX47_06095 [Synechococcaceae bacterium WB8_1B_057]|nr:hypothetical protein [Synechococcaceae bacterium WB6_1A_059]NDG78985.1 hypothetical protein [Synechococcaceae bacterium WB8_1B_057]
MAEVTGRIGQEEVLLNNAATEATLKLLLQATLSANRQSLTAVQNLARQSGLSAQAVQSANQALNVTAASGSKVGRVFESLGFVAGALSSTFKEAVDVSTKLANNQAQASDVFAAFAKIPGPLGVVAGLFEKLANFQQTQLNSYQQITNAGVNFSGSLTDLRLQASMTRLTMAEFSNLIKNNGEIFANMGGTANEGAKAFVRASKSLLDSDAGSQLRALGYSTEQVNQSMLNYIAMTGGRNRKEMQDTEALSKSTAAYLRELDELASITGKSREEEEKKVKQAMMEADFQLFLASKSKEEREAIEANVKRAAVLYGKGGEDIAKANAMGVAVQGEAGKRLTALSYNTAETIKKDLEIRKQGGDNEAALRQNEIDGRKSNAQDLGRFAGAVGSYSGVLKGNEDAVRRAAADRVMGEEAIEEQYSQAARERRERESSEARQAVETKEALEKLGQEILQAVLPAIKTLLPILNTTIQGFSALLTPVAKAVQAITSIPGAMTALGIAVGGLAAVFLAAKVLSVGRTIAGGVSGIMRGGAGIARGAAEGFRTGGVRGAIAGGLSGGAGSALAGLTAGPLGSTPENPMYVAIVKGGPGGGVLDQLTDAIGSKGKGGGISDLAGKIGETLGGSPSSILGKITGQMGNMGKVLGTAGSVLGKVALPLAAGLSAYNAYQGFSADKNAGLGEKFLNAGSSALSGLTFGLLGSSAEEIAARSKKPDLGKEADKSRKEIEEKSLQGQTSTQDKKPTETLTTELNALNKTMNELLKYTKEMTDNTKRTMESIKQLNPSLFPR